MRINIWNQLLDLHKIYICNDFRKCESGHLTIPFNSLPSWIYNASRFRRKQETYPASMSSFTDGNEQSKFIKYSGYVCLKFKYFNSMSCASGKLYFFTRRNRDRKFESVKHEMKVSVLIVIVLIFFCWIFTREDFDCAEFIIQSFEPSGIPR